MIDTWTLLKLSPNKVARMMRTARTIARVSHNMYPVDSVFETLVNVESQRQEQKREDIAFQRRQNFR